MVRFIRPSLTRLKISLYLTVISALAGILTSATIFIPVTIGLFIWWWMEMGAWLYNHDLQLSALLADPRKARTRIAAAIPLTITLGYLLFFQYANLTAPGHRFGVSLGFDLVIVWVIVEMILLGVEWFDRKQNGVSCGQQRVAAYERQVSDEAALHPFKEFINTLDI